LWRSYGIYHEWEVVTWKFPFSSEGEECFDVLTWVPDLGQDKISLSYALTGVMGGTQRGESMVMTPHVVTIDA